jgi:hypothetical protein
MAEVLSVTGHRPPRLGGYGQHVTQRLDSLALRTVAAMRPDRLVTGMALGWDQACARAALALDIPYEAIVPGTIGGYEQLWPPAARAEFNRLLALAGRVEIRAYMGGAEIKDRNERVVELGTWLLSLWDGTPSGTGNTVEMATRRGLPVWNVWKEWA